MPVKEDIVLMASYNAAMNGKLYAAAATLAPEALREDRGAFFGSVIGTLNHLVSADTIWLRRFMGHPRHFAALDALAEIPVAGGLTHVYSEDIDGLLAYRVRIDAIITDFADQLTDTDLSEVLTYRNSRGEFSKRFGHLLLHFFNHQTHHRGQVTTLLSQSGVDIGVTDLLAWIPNEPAATASTGPANLPA